MGKCRDGETHRLALPRRSRKASLSVAGRDKQFAPCAAILLSDIVPRPPRDRVSVEVSATSRQALGKL